MRSDLSLEHPVITALMETGWPREHGRYAPLEDDFISVVECSPKEAEQSE